MSKKNSSLQKKTPNLPESQNISPSIAVKIIEKELNLQRSWDLKTIHELISLYTTMIEHYEQNNNPKFYDFQDRMHKMLIKPQVISALQQANCKKELKTQNNEQKLLSLISPKPPICLKSGKENNSNPFFSEKKSLTEDTSVNHLSQTVNYSKPSRNAQTAIERQSTTSKETAHKAAAGFLSQDLSLQHRLAIRKASQLAKSTSQSPKFSDHSQNSIKEILFDFPNFIIKEHVSSFEQQLDEIMKNSFQEKTGKISEIRFKYESRIAEITGKSSHLFISQIKQDMKEEIDWAVKECDNTRKEAILKLKNQMSR